MRIKAQPITIEELTKNELNALENSDKIAKLEREKLVSKKLLDEFKEREKRASRALVLYERKIKFMKQTVIDDILKICKELDLIKEALLDGEDKNEIGEDIENALDEFFEVCNKLEANATISKSDREFILNKPSKKQLAPQDAESRFDRLKEEFNQKIGSSVARKRGRPKKQDQSIVADIGLGKKSKLSVEIEDKREIKPDKEVAKKLSDLFYGAPANDEKVVSGIAKTEDSLFDFDEALNPNISLSDIMSELMSEKADVKPKTYDATSIGREISKVERNQNKCPETKASMLEAGIIFRRK